MMQMASKEKDRGKKKKAGSQSKQVSKYQRPAAAKLHAARARELANVTCDVTWDDIERQQPFSGREATMVKRAVPVAMSKAPVEVNVAKQPIDCTGVVDISSVAKQEQPGSQDSSLELLVER